MIIVNSSTRQFNIPGADLVFGVESDSGSERKHFQCPRIVGNNLDIAGSFVRINYRNANGDIDSYLVEDLAVDGDNVTFSWVLSPNVVMYKGNVTFVMCVVGPDTKVKWHTTLGRGQVLEGLEPDSAIVEEGTVDVIAQLVAMVEAQTGAVKAVGEKWVADVKAEGATQVQAVQTAAKTAESDAVAEIEAKGVNTRNSIPADYTALSEAVDGLVRGRAGAIVCEVEGSTVVVNDASDNYLQGLRIFGRSTQDGTPTPDAPVEIQSVVNPVVTVASKNLATRVIDYDATVKGVRITASADSSEFTLDGTAETQFSNVAMRSEVLSPGTYTISVRGLHAHTSSLDRIYVAKEIDNKVLANPVQDNTPKTFELDEPTRLRVDLVLMGNSTYNNATIEVQIEVGEVATEYEPHRVVKTLATTHTLPGIPVTSGGNYTDSDGQQWICDEVDLERGVYVQRVSEKTLYDYVDKYCVHSNNSAHSDTILRFDFGYAFGAKVQTLVLCNRLKYSYAHGDAGAVARTAECVSSHSASDIISIFIDGSRLASRDIAGFKAYLLENETVVQYALATPIETPLSETEIAAYRAMHSNYPNTTVLNDAGAHMVVKYAADTKLYIDNKIATLLGG